MNEIIRELYTIEERANQIIENTEMQRQELQRKKRSRKKRFRSNCRKKWKDG